MVWVTTQVQQEMRRTGANKESEVLTMVENILTSYRASSCKGEIILVKKLSCKCLRILSAQLSRSVVLSL